MTLEQLAKIVLEMQESHSPDEVVEIRRHEKRNELELHVNHDVIHVFRPCGEE